MFSLTDPRFARSLPNGMKNRQTHTFILALQLSWKSKVSFAVLRQQRGHKTGSFWVLADRKTKLILQINLLYLYCTLFLRIKTGSALNWPHDKDKFRADPLVLVCFDCINQVCKYQSYKCNAWNNFTRCFRLFSIQFECLILHSRNPLACHD